MKQQLLSRLQRPLPTASAISRVRHQAPPTAVQAALLTGGFDRPYVFGLATALSSQNVCLEVIGSDDTDGPEMHSSPNLHFLNLRGSKEQATLVSKILRILSYYARLIRYAATAKPKIFHILWNNKFQFFDRIVLMLYYRLLAKKVVFTAHNVNAGKRDFNDSLLNRLTLRVQYRLADHIFVHTAKMKRELLEEFGVRERRVTVIPFGINNSVPDSDLTTFEAKQRLGIKQDEKTILFFGGIRPYKGLEYLVDAFRQLATYHPEYRLIIAGKPKEGSEKYWTRIKQQIDCDVNRARIMAAIRYIPDQETEIYFKASDVLALPYRHVFQSGVLFLAYRFGLPVIATDVGCIAEDLVQGRTGFLCRPGDAADLARAIEQYFESDLFNGLASRRHEIREYANEQHSWDSVADITLKHYVELLRDQP